MARLCLVFKFLEQRGEVAGMHDLEWEQAIRTRAMSRFPRMKVGCRGQAIPALGFEAVLGWAVPGSQFPRVKAG